MAAIVHFFDIDLQYRRAMRRERLVRDRSNPLEVYDDVEILERFRFRRMDIWQMTDMLQYDLEYDTNVNQALQPIQQVMIALRFYASGCYQNFVGDMINVQRSTACRAIRRVSIALENRLLTKHI